MEYNNSYNMSPYMNNGQSNGGLLDYLNSDKFGDLGESFGSWGKGLGGFSNLAGGLYSMYQGNKMMGMYEDQLDMEKEKWGISKDELNKLNNTKARLNAQYSGQSTYTAPPAYA